MSGYKGTWSIKERAAIYAEHARRTGRVYLKPISKRGTSHADEMRREVLRQLTTGPPLYGTFKSETETLTRRAIEAGFEIIELNDEGERA